MLCEGMYHPGLVPNSKEGAGGLLVRFLPVFPTGFLSVSSKPKGPLPLLLAVLFLTAAATGLLPLPLGNGLNDAYATLKASQAPRRIVSLSPSGTEALFALGLGPRVAAVTTFCDYPKDALSKPKVGGFSDISVEALISMRADLVVLQDIHIPLSKQLSQAGIPWIMLRQGSVEDIMGSIMDLGNACGANGSARRLQESIARRIGATSNRTRLRRGPKPRVLICVSREMERDTITSFYAAGPGSFYDQLINLAGGSNAIPKSSPQYPLIYPEGLMSINPDVIIDLVGDRRFYHGVSGKAEENLFDKNRILRQWVQSFPWLGAVKNHRVVALEGTVFLRPGPRVGYVLERLEREIWGGQGR